MMTRHLIIRERRVPEPGACSSASERVDDGWYGPVLDTRPPHYMSFLSAGPMHGGRVCQDRFVVHGAPPARALALHVKQTQSGDGVPAYSSTTDVLEYSTAPLPDSVFEPPAGFKQVDYLPGGHPMRWSDRLQYDWNQFERAIGSWFE